MASTKIRGITIELDADTSGISSALKDVNGEIKSTQSQLKDVERLLKMDPGNTELLEQKQRLLGERVTETKTKLESLKKAQEQVNKAMEETGEGQEQYDALTREIIQTENALKDAEREAKSFNVTAQKISASAGKIADKFGKAAQKTKTLSTAAAGALVGLGGLAYKTAQDADELNTLAKQTGFTTAELQKMRYAADLIDVEMDTITSASKKMVKQLGSSEDKFAALGVTTRDTNGELRSMTDIFYDTIKALSQIPNETERDVAAMEIFGKSADDLAGIIDDGGQALRDLGQEADNLGLIIPQEQLDNANELNDAIDRVKAQASGAFAQIGSEIADTLIPYIPVVVEGIQKILDFIKSLDPETLKLIVTVLAFTAALSPLLSALSGVATAVSALSTAFTFFAANPAVLMVAVIVGLIAVIALFGDEIQSTLKEVDNYLQNVFAKDWRETFGEAGNVVNGFSNGLKNTWDSLKEGLDGIINFIRGVFTGDWKRAWFGVNQIFFSIMSGLGSILKAPLNGVIGVLNMAVDGLNRLIDGLNSMTFDIPSWLGGGTFGVTVPHIPNIPYLAKGGTVSSGSAIVGEAGAELLTVANGRATVQPLTNNTTNTVGPTTINVYGAPGQDVNELANIISEKIAFNTARIRNAW